MDVPILLSVLSPIATLGGVFFLNNILKGYLSKKSENLATKQDIEEITDKIESVKIIYASQLHVSQVRYEKEFEILSDLTAKLVEMRDAALSLRPVIDFVPKDEEVERGRRLKRLYEASRNLYISQEEKRPFYPDNIYTILHEIARVAHKEATDYRYNDSETRHKDYWDEAQKHAMQITELSEKALILIRDRARWWEKFDAV